MKMYIAIGVICPDNIRFRVPHREKPMKAKHIARKFPEFAKEFDGSSSECTLQYYYVYNKTEEVFEFKDPDCEEEVAELLGVNLTNDIIVDEEISTGSVLTKEEIAQVHEHIADIRAGLKKLKEL